MADFITAIFNNSGTILAIIVFYLLSLWLMFCLWIFMDSMRRYHNIFVAVLFTLLVFIFNFPALIFYLIIRPEDEAVAGANGSGVNVPLVNFVDQDGQIQMSINLKLGAQMSMTPDMNVNVDWDGNVPTTEYSSKSMGTSQVSSTPTKSSKASALSQRLNFFRSRAGESIKQAVDNSKKKVEDYSQNLNDDVEPMGMDAGSEKPGSSKKHRK